MRIERLIGLALCAGLCGLNALADDGEGFRARLVGSAPGEHVAGVPSGSAPWTIARSKVKIGDSGNIDIEARGLLISSGMFVNTVGPVTMVMASVVCGDVDAADTASVPLSPSGDFQITGTISIPSPCIAPAVLIRVSATTGGPLANGPFIAINAITSGGGDQDDH